MLVLHGTGASGPHRPQPRLATAQMILSEAKDEAVAIVADAQAQARKLAADAEASRDAVTREAYAEGLRRGHEAATQLVAEETAGLLAVLRQAAGSASQVRETLIGGSERQLVTLALEVASRILGERARVDHDLVLQMARRAVQRVSRQNAVHIRVNPEESERVAAMLYELPEGAGWPVESDEAVNLGGCIIDTRTGFIDARLDTQLDQVGAALLALTEGFDG